MSTGAWLLIVVLLGSPAPSYQVFDGGGNYVTNWRNCSTAAEAIAAYYAQLTWDMSLIMIKCVEK